MKQRHMTNTTSSQLSARPPTDSLPGPAAIAFEAFLLTVGYYFLASLGRSLSTKDHEFVILWYANGFLLGTLLLRAYRLWPVYLSAALVADVAFDFSTGKPLTVALLFFSSNALSACASAAISRRFIHERPQTLSLRVLVVLLFSVVFIGAPLGALGGAATAVTYIVPDEPFLHPWLIWWSGDLFGSIIVLPLFLSIAALPRHPKVSRSRAFEFGGILCITALVSILVFSGSTQLFLFRRAVFTMPVLVWAALRFGMLGATTNIALFTAVGTYFSSHGIGPYAIHAQNLHAAVIDLQSLLGIQVTTVLITAAMVTERERLALRALAHQALVSSIASATTDAIFAKDTEGRYLMINDAALAMINKRRDEVIGNTDAEIFCAGDREHIERCDRAALASLTSATLEETIRLGDGKPHTLLTTKGPLIEPDGRVLGIYGASRDITARKAAEIELSKSKEDLEHSLRAEREARAEAEAAIHARDTFLAMVSHELRSPLSPISAAATLLQELPGLPAEAPELIESIQKGVRTETRLITDLLDLTRLGTGGLSLNRREFDLRMLLSECISDHQEAAREHGIELVHSIDLSEARCLADPTRLSQVLRNLIDNALKFTPAPGKVEIRCSNPSPTRIRVEVQDSGIGMDESALSKLFQLFEQGDSSVTRRFQGMGIGLYLSRILTEMHGGTIGAVSAGPGKGATFIVELPAARPCDANQADTPVKAANHKSSRILLIEDNAITLKLVTRFLQRQGYNVVCAGSAAEAHAAALAGNFDLIISDLGLPDLSGWDLLPELQSIRPVPAIAMSGFSSPRDIGRSLNAGFCQHLVKPLELGQLIKVIESLTQPP